MSRPERIAPPDLYYDETEASKYTGNSRIMTIQTTMSERCLELLNFSDGHKLVLDIGCGSGISGDVLSASEHAWVGLDISRAMLDIAVEREVEGDVLLNDIGQGFGFRAGMFDGCISVSALQWLCYSDSRDLKAARRLNTFFSSLYRCLRRGARAALQFYPESPEQLELISTAALRCGFTGGVVVDFPNSTKAKKYFLCVFAGVDPDAARRDLPIGRGVAAAGGGGATGGVSPFAVPYEARRHQHTKPASRLEGRRPVKSKAWITAKKDAQRAQGRDVRPDSKYTGRKRTGFKAR